jgi:hypothetical protein
VCGQFSFRNKFLKLSRLMNKQKNETRRGRNLLGMFCCLLLFSSSACVNTNPYLERDICGAVTLPAEWLEIKPTEPLKQEREISSIHLTFATKYELNKQSNGYHFPDGEVVLPEVQLVDQEGKVYQLGIASIGDRGVGFSSHNPVTGAYSLPMHKVFTTVRIRSKKPFQCSKITWSGYNIRDRK